MSQVNVNESVNENVNVVSNEEQNIVSNNSYQNVIKKLIASGCKRINSVKVKNVNFTDKDLYTRVSFTLGNPIKGFVSEDGGVTYKEGMTSILYTSLFAIVGAIKEDENLAWMGNALLENPKAMNLIFNGGNIDIIQQEIPAGVEFINPFSNKENPDTQVYDHDIIINYIIGFKLGKVGEKMADRLADKLMGF